jgi:hypothetical protein
MRLLRVVEGEHPLRRAGPPQRRRVNGERGARGQIEDLGAEVAPGGEDGGALEHVGELAQIARPSVLGELGQAVLRDSHPSPARASRLLLEEHHRKAGQVLEPVAERRQVQGEDAQAIVEVLSESALPDGAGQIHVGRGEDTDVDLDRAVAAHRLEATLLQDPEQLRLKLDGQLADLVEQERASVGHLEAARAIAVRSREGALDVTEELALQQAGGDGRAVDRRERLVRPGAPLVMARARRSFPVPVSPRISTGVCVSETCRALRARSRMAALRLVSRIPSASPRSWSSSTLAWACS